MPTFIDVPARCRAIIAAYTWKSNTKYHELLKQLERELPGVKYYLLDAGILGKIVRETTKSIEVRDNPRVEKHREYANNFAPPDVVEDMLFRACPRRAGELFKTPERRVDIWALIDWAQANRPSGMSKETVLYLFAQCGVERKKLPMKPRRPRRTD